MVQAEQAPLTFSNKALLYMIIPAILNDLFSRLVGIVDSVMVSSVGEVAVSAISLTSSLFMVFTNFVEAFAIGSAVLFAQYLGSRDKEAGETAVRHSFWLGLIIAGIIALIVIPLATPLMSLVFPGSAPDIRSDGILCLRMSMLYLPFYAIEQISIYIFISMGKNKYVMLINVGKNVMNVLGNALFIHVFHWGLLGALLSTVLSHALFSALAICLLHNNELPLHFTRLFPPRLNKQQIGLLFKVCSVTVVERALFYMGNLLCASMLSGLSAAEIAANSVSKNFVSIGWAIAFAFSATISSVVGRCVGADQPDQAKYYTKRLILPAWGISAVLFLIVFLLRQSVVNIYDLEAGTKALAANYVGIGCLLTVFGGHTLVVYYSSAFRAAGDLKFVTVTAIASMFLSQVALGYIFIFVFKLGVVGFWLGLGADWFFRSIFYTIHFYRGKWLGKKVI